MATVMYNCRRCKIGKRVEYSDGRQSNGYKSWPYRIDPKLGRVFPGAFVESCGGGKPTVYGGAPEGLCDQCGKVMAWGELRGHVNADVPCNAKCTASRGPSCECSCGGKNHGAGWGSSRMGKPLSEVLA